MNELYRALGVTPEATGEELKRAYRTLAKKLHPDLHPDDPGAEARFKEVNEAYDVLGNPERRREYDAAQRAEGQASRSQRGPSVQRRPASGPVDFSQMAGGFAQFFGFDPQTGEVTGEEKLKGKKNPLDTSDLFEKFMGFK